MVPPADRVKKPGKPGKPGQSSVWLDAKKPRSGGSADGGSGAGSGTGGGSGGGSGSRAGGGGRRSETAAAKGSGRPAAPGLDRERITAATVELLDAEGLAKFSMRRLAAELNVTAMSVYWYVATKDDLLELALDRVAGELTVPDPDDDTDWRVQLRQLAYSYRELMVGHPWATSLMGRYLNIGPRFMAFHEATLGVMRKTGLPLARQAGTMAAVFQFVFGYATSEVQFHQRAAEAGLSADEFFQESMGLIAGELENTQLFRDSTALMEARGGDTVAEMYGRDFDYALDILIAGIEATGAAHGTP
ncbi:TetR/AcrR family transcriptional regulator [Streptomyces sp. NPDC058657]|uniref:TetR/AcrR family transcriptional regulator n=1 Tax=unclassified Streptomyces TaxID=2593676 RepID=UPI003664033C